MNESSKSLCRTQALSRYGGYLDESPDGGFGETPSGHFEVAALRTIMASWFDFPAPLNNHGGDGVLIGVERASLHDVSEGQITVSIAQGGRESVAAVSIQESNYILPRYGLCRSALEVFYAGHYRSVRGLAFIAERPRQAVSSPILARTLDYSVTSALRRQSSYEGTASGRLTLLQSSHTAQ